MKSLLSKKYIRKAFMKHDIQLNEDALNELSFKLKQDIHNYALKHILYFWEKYICQKCFEFFQGILLPLVIFSALPCYQNVVDSSLR